MKYLLTLYLLLSVFLGNAQLQVGSSEMSAMNHAGKLSPKDFTRLKATTTLFVLQESDFEHLDDFEQAIKRVWTVTPFKIIHYNEIGKYAINPSCSIFSFDAFVVFRNNSTNTHISYCLWMGSENKRGKFSQDQFARIMVHPDWATTEESMRLTMKEKSQSRFNDYLYQKANFSNWGAGFLTGYLGVINNLIKAEELQGVYTEANKKEELRALKSDTLYIPDYVNIHFNKFNGKETLNEDKDEESFSASYKSPIKILSTSELNRLILENSRPISYLVYTRSSTDKFVSIYSTANGLVYSNYTPMSYNFKGKDLRGIAKFVEE